MSNFELILLGIALGMDCFSVCLAIGLKQQQFVVRIMLPMAILFGAFQALMPLIGWAATVYFSGLIESVDHWIAFVLLAFIGVKMIIDGRKPAEEQTFDPSKFIVMITLAVATSIDALAVGVSFTCMGIQTFVEVLKPIIIIGITSTVMSLLGNYIGIFAGKKFHIPAEIIGGIILIFIGTKILYEHLF